jgi:hypothetical protein
MFPQFVDNCNCIAKCKPEKGKPVVRRGRKVMGLLFRYKRPPDRRRNSFLGGRILIIKEVAQNSGKTKKSFKNIDLNFP